MRRATAARAGRRVLPGGPYGHERTPGPRDGPGVLSGASRYASPSAALLDNRSGGEVDRGAGHGCHDELAACGIHAHALAVAERTAHEEVADAVVDLALDDAAQRTAPYSGS